jgi:hypothetical protein
MVVTFIVPRRYNGLHYQRERERVRERDMRRKKGKRKREREREITELGSVHQLSRPFIQIQGRITRGTKFFLSGSVVKLLINNCCCRKIPFLLLPLLWSYSFLTRVSRNYKQPVLE